MKTALFISFIVVFVNFAECINFHKSVFSSTAKLDGEHKRAVGELATCYQVGCVTTGSSCVESAACRSCNNQFETCLTNTSDICGCATQFVQCAVINATDDRTNCNPTIIYETCKSLDSSCPCYNFTQNVPISTCNYESFCNNSTGKCQAQSGEGQFCSTDNDCRAPFYDQSRYTCKNNQCALAQYSVSIGSSCSSGDDCVNAYTGEVSCANGLCVGQNQGGNCTNDASCNFNLFCSNGLCEPFLTEGSTCDINMDNCGYPTVCGYGSKCVEALTKERGQNCESDFECVAGSACVNKVCAAPPASKQCTGNTDCPISSGYTGVCDCNPWFGKTMCSSESSGITTCYAQLESFYNCVFKYNCTSTDLSNRCVATNCIEEAKCMYSCSLDATGTPVEACYPSLTCASTTGTTGTTGMSGVSAVQASVGLVAAAVAVALTL